MSEKEGKEYRLPTEAQWEYTCRAGNPGRRWFSTHPRPLPTPVEENLLTQCAWFSANAGGRTHPAGQLRANAWGLYDVYGNVWEWCADWYDAGYYANSPVDDPTGPASGSDRVLRGGCWGDYPGPCRSALRSRDLPVARSPHLGFRVAYSVDASSK